MSHAVRALIIATILCQVLGRPLTKLPANRLPAKHAFDHTRHARYVEQSVSLARIVLTHLMSLPPYNAHQ